MSQFDRFCLILGRAAVLLVLALVPLVLAEGVARLLHQPAPLRRVYDPYAYRIPQPNLVDEFVGRDGEPVSVRLNELGMRGPSPAEALRDDGLTLVFLGGSTTENYDLPREQTFPELVGNHLRESLGRRVRIFNAGMSSTTSSISLARLQHQVLDLEPSMVVVMHGINDLLLGLHPRYRADGRHLPRPAAVGRRPRSFAIDWLRHRRPSWLEPRSVEERRIESWQDFPALRVYERNLRSMAAIAADRDIAILFLTQATRYRTASEEDRDRFRFASRVAAKGAAAPDAESLARGMDAFNATVTSLPRGRSIHVFDLAGRLPPTAEMMWDECHLTRSGNRRVAEELGSVIETILH